MTTWREGHAVIRPVCPTISFVSAGDFCYGRFGGGRDIDSIGSKDVISAVKVEEMRAGAWYVRKLEIVAFSQDGF